MTQLSPSSMTWAELLGELRSTPVGLRTWIMGLSRERMCRRDEDVGWSPREMVGHLCATELPYRARLVRIVLEESPRVAEIGRLTGGYDPETPVEFLLDAFASLRSDTVAFLESLPVAARARTAEHVTLGLITLRGQVEAILEHDQGHLEKLRQLLP
jgi:DinB superfamily